MKFHMREGRFVHRLGMAWEIPTADAAYEAIRKIVFPNVARYTQEEMWALLLNARRQLTHTVLVSRGTSDSTLAAPSIIFREAIVLGASAIIVTHNHPSGCVEPSHEDLAMTARLRRAGEIVAIPLADHIIVARDGWYSCAASGSLQFQA